MKCFDSNCPYDAQENSNFCGRHLWNVNGEKQDQPGTGGSGEGLDGDQPGTGGSSEGLAGDQPGTGGSGEGLAGDQPGGGGCGEGQF